MKDIPFNIELETIDGCKCIVFGEVPGRAKFQLPGIYLRSSGDWCVTCWHRDDPDILGLWADRESTEDERVEVFRQWLRGKTIEVRDACRDWELVENPKWLWGRCQYRVKKEPLPEQATTTTWLIERNDRGIPEWLADVTSPCARWTDDVDQAIQFCRFSDAEKVRRMSTITPAATINNLD